MHTVMSHAAGPGTIPGMNNTNLSPDELAGGSAEGLSGGIDRRTMVDHVADRLRQMIFDGELKTGEHIKQEIIAAQLGVSRQPIRHAIVTLDREGWIQVRPHSGAFVRGLDENDIRDHYEMRALMHGLIVRRAIERGTSADFAEVSAMQARLDGADSADAMSDAYWLYLRHIVEMARSPRLFSGLRAVASPVPGNFFALVPEAIGDHKEFTAEITSSILVKDAVRAGQVFRAMLEKQCERVLELLQEKRRQPGPDERGSADQPEAGVGPPLVG
jgi:DNA-binding GntR family transcriptional regulator